MPGETPPQIELTYNCARSEQQAAVARFAPILQFVSAEMPRRHALLRDHAKAFQLDPECARVVRNAASAAVHHAEAFHDACFELAEAMRAAEELAVIQLKRAFIKHDPFSPINMDHTLEERAARNERDEAAWNAFRQVAVGQIRAMTYVYESASDALSDHLDLLAQHLGLARESKEYQRKIWRETAWEHLSAYFKQLAIEQLDPFVIPTIKRIREFMLDLRKRQESRPLIYDGPSAESRTANLADALAHHNFVVAGLIAGMTTLSETMPQSPG